MSQQTDTSNLEIISAAIETLRTQIALIQKRNPGMTCPDGYMRASLPLLITWSRRSTSYLRKGRLITTSWWISLRNINKPLMMA